MAKIAQRERRITPTPALSPVGGDADVQAGFAGVQQQLGGDVGEILERKRRLDTIDNNTWLLNTTNDYQRRARELYVPLFNAKGADAAGGREQTAKFFKSVSDEIAKNAPNDEYKNLAMEQISRLHNSNENKLIINETRQVEQGNIDAIGEAADEVAEDVFTNGGGVEAIEAGIDVMADTISAYGSELGSEKIDELNKATSQHIANTAINRRMRIDPEGTADDLEAGKYSKWITQEDREKHLKNARTEAKWQKDQAREAVVEDQDDKLAAVVKEPSVAAVQELKELYPDDAKWQATLANMEKSMVTATKKETRQRNYVDTMQFLNRDDVDPGKVTDTQIMSMVGGNLEDFTKVKSYMDDILRNPSQDRMNYQIALKEMETDYENGLFGDFGTTDALDSYGKQLETMRLWAIKNPEKNPLEHYKTVVAPQPIKPYQRAIDSIPIINLFYNPTPGATPESTELARQEAEIGLRTLPATRRANAQEILRRAGKQGNQATQRAIMARLEQIEDSLRAQGRSDAEIAAMTIDDLLGIDATLEGNNAP
jgi:hypothetical protein